MQPLELSIADRIATIRLNRPEKRNALNGELIAAFLKMLNQLKVEKAVQLLMIQGNGKHFCAGADIEWMQHIAALSETENYDDAQQLADLLHELYFYPKPTLVLAQGATFGGGIGLLCACDIAIADDQSFFSFSEVKMGLAPSTISPYVLAAIGERQAHYYFLTAERFDVREALRIGLIHRIAEQEAFHSTGLMIAKQILQNSPSALSASKQLIRYVSKQKIDSALSQKTAEHLANLRDSPDAKEGLSAFLQKRAPQWK